MFSQKSFRRLVSPFLVLGLVFAVFYASESSSAQDLSGTIRVASPTTPIALGNPFFRDDGTSTRVALFDALTSLSRDAKLQPSLAVSWEVEAANKWVFKLREGVTFHNGEPFDAEAVVATFDYLTSPDAARFFVTRYASTIEAARALDSLTVEITTREPDPILPNRLANVAIVAPQAWQELGVDGFTQEPVGTGPFTLQDWGGASRIVEFEAFDQAWRKSHSVKSVRLISLPDSTTRLQALLSDQVDIAVNLDPDNITDIESAGLNVIVLPAPHVVTMALRNVGEVSEALLDKRVRQALNYAVNKQAMADQVLYGLVRVPSQAATPEVFGFNPRLEPYAYDPARARTLLEQAGYEKGLSLTFGVYSGQTPADTLLFQLMRQDLAAVGVDVELRTLPFPDLLRRIDSGEWNDIDAYSATLSSAWFGDVSQAIERLSCNYPTPFFCDSAVTELIEESSREMNRERRETLLQNVLAEFHDLAPALLLVDYSAITGTSGRVENYRARSNGVQFEEIILVD